MPQQTPIFRLFVSSIFIDMQTERNLLQKRVFPEIERMCQQHGAIFQVIDLRWGISNEAVLSQQVVSICLGEIKRCQMVTRRPNFLVLMGDRYGWRPLPTEIPATEFTVLAQYLTVDEVKELKSWYTLDENAVPAHYVLQSTSDKDTWYPVEERLRGYITRVLPQCNFTQAQRLKYEASVTEQEIQAGIFDNIDNANDAAMVCFRTLHANGLDATAYSPANPQAAARLAHLRERLVTTLHDDNLFHYDAQITRKANQRDDKTDENGDKKQSKTQITLDDATQFCQQVEAFLKTQILAELSDLSSESDLKIEEDAHRTFLNDRVQNFQGRADVLSQVQHYLAHPATEPLILHGASGVGKTSLMAQVVNALLPNTDHTLIYRFIGATPDSSDARILLNQISQSIYNVYDVPIRAVPDDYYELAENFSEYLTSATPENPLIIILDSLDQLSASYGAQSLTWVPATLPENVHIIVSTIPGYGLDVLRERISAAQFVQVNPMTVQEGQHLLDFWLRNAGRTLTPAQKQHVLTCFEQVGLPLYLKFAFEEARLWHSYEQPTALKIGLQQIIKENLFARLSEVINHGKDLVKAALTSIVAARNGLSETELLDVLAKDSELYDVLTERYEHAEFDQDEIPIVLWARLQSDLSPYMTERRVDGIRTLGFYHRQIDAAIESLNDSHKRHRILADYFSAQELYFDAHQPNLRKLSEQLYQQAYAHLPDAFIQSVVSAPFILAQLRERSTSAFIADLDLPTESQLVLSGEQIQGCQLLQATLRLSRHLIDAAQADVLVVRAQLRGRLLDNENPIVQAVLADFATMKDDRPWLVPQVSSLIQPGSLFRLALSGHQGEVRNVVLSPEETHALSYGVDNRLIEWDIVEGRQVTDVQVKFPGVQYVLHVADLDTIFCVDATGDARLLDPRTGQLLNEYMLHNGLVAFMVVATDYAMSGGADGYIKFWVPQTGEILASHRVYGDYLVAAQTDIDFGIFTCVQNSNVLRRWDLKTQQVKDFAQADSGYLYARVVPDQSAVVALTQYGTLYVYEEATGDLRHELTILPRLRSVRDVESLQREFQRAAANFDGRYGMAGYDDGRVRAWQVLDNIEMPLDHQHTAAVKIIRPHETESVCASVDTEGQIFVWDMTTGTRLCHFKGHQAPVTIIHLLKTSPHVFSVDSNGYMIRWHRETGEIIDSRAGEKSYHSPDQMVLSSDESFVILGRKNSRDVYHYTLEPLEFVREIRTGVMGLETIAGIGDVGFFAISKHEIEWWDVDKNAPIFAEPRMLENKSISHLQYLTKDFVLYNVWGNANNRQATIYCWNKFQNTIMPLVEAQLPVVHLPGTHRALTASVDHRLLIWDLRTGARINDMTTHTVKVRRLVVINQQTQLAALDMDNVLKIYSLPDLQLVHEQQLDQDYHIINDGAHLLAMNKSKKLIVRETEQNKIVQEIVDNDIETLYRTFAENAYAITVSKELKSEVSGGNQFKRVKLWNLVSGDCMATVISEGNRFRSPNFSAIWFTRDLRYLLLAHNYQLRIWDRQHDRIVWDGTPHSGEVNDWTHDSTGHIVLSASQDQTIRIWDIQETSLIEMAGGRSGTIMAIAYAPDDSVVAFTTGFGTVKVYDVRTAQLLYTHENAHGALQILGVAFSADSQHMITGGDDRTIAIWDAHTGEEQHRWTVQASIEDLLVVDKWVIARLRSRTHAVMVWDIMTGVAVTIFEDADGKMAYLNPRQQRVFYSSEKGSIILYDIAARSVIMAGQSSHKDTIYCAVASDDRLFVGVGRGNIAVWDLETLTELVVIKAHKYEVKKLAISADGRYLFSLGYGDGIKLWDTWTGDELRYMPTGYRSASYNQTVDISSDGRTALLAANNRLILSDLITNQVIAQYTIDGMISACRLSFDRQSVVVGEENGGTHLLEVKNMPEHAPLDTSFNLAHAWKDPSPQMQRAAIYHAERHRDTRSVRQLLRYLNGTILDEQRMAANALAKIKPKRVHKLLHEQDASLRRIALFALDQQKRVSKNDRMMLALIAGDVDTIVAAGRGIESMISNTLSDVDETVRKTALRALTRIGHTSRLKHYLIVLGEFAESGVIQGAMVAQAFGHRLREIYQILIDSEMALNQAEKDERTAIRDIHQNILRGTTVICEHIDVDTQANIMSSFPPEDRLKVTRQRINMENFQLAAIRIIYQSQFENYQQILVRKITQNFKDKVLEMRLVDEVYQILKAKDGIKGLAVTHLQSSLSGFLRLIERCVDDSDIVFDDLLKVYQTESSRKRKQVEAFWQNIAKTRLVRYLNYVERVNSDAMFKAVQSNIDPSIPQLINDFAENPTLISRLMLSSGKNGIAKLLDIATEAPGHTDHIRQALASYFDPFHPDARIRETHHYERYADWLKTLGKQPSHETLLLWAEALSNDDHDRAAALLAQHTWLDVVSLILGAFGISADVGAVNAMIQSHMDDAIMIIYQLNKRYEVNLQPLVALFDDETIYECLRYEKVGGKSINVRIRRFAKELITANESLSPDKLRKALAEADTRHAAVGLLNEDTLRAWLDDPTLDEKSASLVRQQLSAQYAKQGKQRIKEGDVAGGITWYQQAKDVQPDNASLSETLAELHYKLGQHDAASVAIHDARQLLPQSVDYYLWDRLIHGEAQGITPTISRPLDHKKLLQYAHDAESPLQTEARQVLREMDCTRVAYYVELLLRKKKKADQRLAALELQHHETQACIQPFYAQALETEAANMLPDYAEQSVGLLVMLIRQAFTERRIREIGKLIEAASKQFIVLLQAQSDPVLSAFARFYEAESHLEVVKMDVKQGKLQNAIQTLTREIKRVPDYDVLYAERAAVHNQLQDWQAAWDDYDKAATLNPDELLHQLRRAIAAANLNDHVRAFADYDNLAKRDEWSSLWQVFYHRGNLYASMGEHENAIKDFSRALDLFPSALGYMPFARGRSYYHLQNYEKALDDFLIADSQLYKDKNTLQWLCITYRQLCREDEELNAINQAVERHPDLASNYWLRSETYRRRGMTDQMRNDLEKAKTLDPKNVTYLRLFLESLSNQATADEAFEQARHQLPESAELLYAEARVRYCFNDFTTAVRKYQAVYQAYPDYHTARYEEILAYLNLKQHDSAEKAAQSTMQAASTHSLAYHWAGVVALAGHDYTLAYERFTQAHALPDAHPHSSLTLAISQIMAGQTDDAQRILEQQRTDWLGAFWRAVADKISPDDTRWNQVIELAEQTCIALNQHRARLLVAVVQDDHAQRTDALLAVRSLACDGDLYVNRLYVQCLKHVYPHVTELDF